jgi:S1-C subfamily serine protease
VLNETVHYLGERPEPLSTSLRAGAKSQAAQASSRRVSFGTVPDFTYTGEGVRLDDVRAGSPAALAGLRKGDIIVVVNERPVGGMRAYSDALKKLTPGDEIRVRFLRDGAAKTLVTHVNER